MIPIHDSRLVLECLRQLLVELLGLLVIALIDELGFLHPLLGEELIHLALSHRFLSLVVGPGGGAVVVLTIRGLLLFFHSIRSLVRLRYLSCLLRLTSFSVVYLINGLEVDGTDCKRLLALGLAILRVAVQSRKRLLFTLTHSLDLALETAAEVEESEELAIDIFLCCRIKLVLHKVGLFLFSLARLRFHIFLVFHYHF